MPLFCFKLVQISLKDVLSCTYPADGNRVLISLPRVAVGTHTGLWAGA